MTNKKKQELSGQDYLTFYTNKFLSTSQGKDILSRIFEDDHDVKKQIMKQLDVHEKLMEQFISPKNEQVALGGDAGSIIPGYIRLPNNTNKPKNA